MFKFLQNLVGGNSDSANKKKDQTDVYGAHGKEIDLDIGETNHGSNAPVDHTGTGKENTGSEGNEVLIMNTKNEDRPTSFFAQPGILAGNLFRNVLIVCLFLYYIFIYFL